MDAQIFKGLLPEKDDYFIDMHTAASLGCEERVRDILDNESKSTINVQNSCGWTPLMYASCCTNLKVLLLLLEENADVGIQNLSGETALILASKCGSTDAVNMLVNGGANVNDIDHKGWSALFFASAFGHRSVVQLLIDAGSDLDLVDLCEGSTALMIASAFGHERIVVDLLQAEANPVIVSKLGDTARSLADYNGHLKIVNLLDVHLTSKKRPPLQKNLGSSDLKLLLEELGLSKYYPLFENHGIDLKLFYSLTDSNLKDLGITLLGPRKKMVLTIAKWQQTNKEPGLPKQNDASALHSEVEKQKKLKAELECALKHERELRKAAEKNLGDSMKTLKTFTEAVQKTMAYNIRQQETFKQYLTNLRRILSHSPDVGWPKFRSEVVLPQVESLEKLVLEIHQRSLIAFQQTCS